LEAITQNNSPRYDWGPKKHVNQYGIYAHLQNKQSKEEMVMNEIRSRVGTGHANGSFHSEKVFDSDEIDDRQTTY
jgi:hypothetical protein